MSKPRFDRHTALEVARELVKVLVPLCEEKRLIVAGSLRRMKQWVGDVEIVYISRTEPRQVDFFKLTDRQLADAAILEMEKSGILARRETGLGHTTYGNQNKLMVHCRTGVPVDLFATCETSWFNYLVCRTGPKESNMAISEAAIAKGWKWHPYGSGFIKPDGSEAFDVRSEKDVFDFVGLPFKEPKDRK